MKIRQHDTLPALQARAFTDGAFVDLTQFATIVMRMVSGATVVTGSATGDALGNLSYAWQAGDTDVVGTYAVVFVGTTAGGRVQTFPTGTNLTIEVVAAI